MISAGLSVIVDRFYGDVSGSKAYDGSDTFDRDFSFTNVFDPGTGASTSGIGNATGDSEWDRWEYSLAFGYLATENLSVFLGYRKSELDLKANSVATLGGVQLGSTVKYNFEQDGPFIGANYVWRFSKGALAGNLALNALDGNFRVVSVETNSNNCFS